MGFLLRGHYFQEVAILIYRTARKGRFWKANTAWKIPIVFCFNPKMMVPCEP